MQAHCMPILWKIYLLKRRFLTRNTAVCNAGNFIVSCYLTNLLPLKKLIPALACLFLKSILLNGQNANFSTKGFHISSDPYFIDCAVKQPDGKFLISGSFHRFDNKAVANLVRFTSQGEFDSSFNLSSGTDQTIAAIAAHTDGSIVLAGNFTQYQKQRVQIPLIRVGSGGVLDATFQPQRSGIIAHGITAMQVQPDGKVLVAGYGIHSNYVAQYAVMRLNKDGSVDQSFLTKVADDYIRGIKISPDSSIVIYGNFRLWNHSPATGLVRLKSTGEADPGFVLPGSGLQAMYGGWATVSQVLILPDTGLLVAGNFNNYNGTLVNKIVKLHNDGSRNAAFNMDPGIAVSWFDNVELLTDGGIVVSGSGSINGKLTWFIKVKEDGSLFTANSYVGPDQYPAYSGSKGLFATGQGEFIAIGAYNGKVNGINLGVFNKFNAATQPYLNRLLPFTRKGRIVETAVDSAHRIIVVGSFNQYGDGTGDQRNHIARLMPDGSLDAGFMANGANDFIGSVAVQKNGQVLVAGNFTALNGKAANNIGRFNEDGSVDLHFNPGAGPGNGYMYDLHVSESQDIYVAGSFGRFDNVLHQGVAKLYGNGSVDHGFTTTVPGVYAPYSITTLPGNKVLYGEGSDLTVRYFDKPMRINKVDMQGTPDPSFNPPVIDFTVTKKVRVGAGGAIYWLGTIFHDNNNPTRIDQPIIKLFPDGALDTIALRKLPSNLFINDFEILPNNKLVIACKRIGVYDSLDIVMRLNPDLSVDSSFVPVSLLYNLDHINHDGNDKIIVAGEPKRAFRLENEQMQNIAVIMKNGLELQTNHQVVKNILDTAAISKGSVGATNEQVFTIKNTGSTTIELLDPATAGVSGQHSTDFSIVTKTNVTSLKPNESMQFTVKFSPILAGNKNAQIKIPFSDGIQQLYAVPIVATASASATVTAVEDLPGDDGIRVYPNPLQGSSIHVAAEELVKSYELIDASGQVLQKGTLKGQGTYTIQLRKNIKGLFFLKLKTDKKEIVTKMISF
jgi:uncharacterized delta-60 repeat protein